MTQLWFGYNRRPVPFCFRQYRSVLAIVVFLCGGGFGQASRKAAPKNLDTSWKLIAVKVTGSQRFKPEEIIAASGLQIGQTASEEDFKKASERLGATGIFGDVTYGFQYSPAGAKLDLQVTDNPQLVPARFENLVWFSDQELLQLLQARVPLFRGQLPLGGDLADEVSEALQALLIEHQVQGQADYIREAAKDKPIEAIIFSVSAHDVQIGEVDFPGAGAAELALLREAAEPLRGQNYRRSIVQANERFGFLPVFLRRGYLKATFGQAQPKVVRDSAQETTVDVTIPVDPRKQYKLTGLQWSGNKVFSDEELQNLIQLKTGQPANAVQLDEDLRHAQQLYGTRGYMAAELKPVPEMADESAEVKYEIQVNEGDQYHMGELEIRGLDSKLTDLLTTRWRLREGDTYDSSYIGKFLQDTAKDLPADARWKPTIHVSLDDKAKTVDVSLSFEKRSVQ